MKDADKTDHDSYSIISQVSQQRGIISAIHLDVSSTAAAAIHSA